MRRRLDSELVRRGLAESTRDARRYIEARRVTVNGAPADSAARQVASSDAVHLEDPPPRYVSRGGLKLEGALADFGIDPSGWVCVDVGSSTGGFTDCLLQAGAKRVVCVDVGTNQIHERIRNDPRVEVHEKTDVRDFRPGGEFDLLVADLSFISLRSVLESLCEIATGAPMLLLVKPQFEVDASRAPGGVVALDSDRADALASVVERAAELGRVNAASADSRVHGVSGNREIFLCLR